EVNTRAMECPIAPQPAFEIQNKFFRTSANRRSIQSIFVRFGVIHKAAVGRFHRRKAAVVSHLLGPSRAHWLLPDLIAAGSVRREIDIASVARPPWHYFVRRLARKPPGRAAAGRN